jgi:hypothetical protein
MNPDLVYTWSAKTHRLYAEHIVHLLPRGTEIFAGSGSDNLDLVGGMPG